MSQPQPPPADHPLDDLVRALPSPALDRAAGARVHAQARAAFTAAADARPRRRSRALESILESVLVAGIVAGYFAWTATALGALRGAGAGEMVTADAVQAAMRR